MLEHRSNETSDQLILSPNKSMTWETNRKILLVMIAVALIIGLSFAYIGAWMILPFAGIEVALVGFGMYYVCWKLNFKEIITLEGDSLILQKGVYFPKEEWRWQASQTWLAKQPSKYRMSAPTLFLQHLNHSEEIGLFLNRAEKKELRNLLIKLGLPSRSLPKK